MPTPHSYGTITEPSRPLNKDALAMVRRASAIKGAQLALDPIQHEQPEYMVASIAVLLAAVVNRCRLDPEDMYRMGLKLMRDPPQEGGDRGASGAIQSLRDFAGIRIMGERDVPIS